MSCQHGFHGNPKPRDMSSISVLASILSMAKIGLTLTKVQSEVPVFNNIFSKTEVYPNIPVR